MIEDLKIKLIDQKLIKNHQKVHFSARLCGNWSVQCFVDNRLKYFIKIAQGSSLQKEVSACTMAAKLLPVCALPIIHSEQAPFEYYIQEASEHDSLPRSFRQCTTNLQDHLHHYFQLSAQQRVLSLDVATEQKWTSFQARPLYLIPQHSDFTVHNLGRGAHGLLIFDWEDYAQSHFPLLDLISLLASFAQFQMDAFYEALRERALSIWLGAVLSHYELKLEHFLQLVPYGLSEFLELKYKLGYDQAIQQRLKIAVQQSLAHTQASTHA